METPRARRYVFTINNYNEDELDRIANRFQNHLEGLTDHQRAAAISVRCLVAEKETGQQGTPHIQGYIEFGFQVYRRVLEALLGGRAFIDQAGGSRADNVRYCTKEGEENLIINYYSNEVERQRTQRLIENQNIKKTADEKAVEILEDIEELTEKDFEAKHPAFYLRSYSKYKELQHVKKQKTQSNYNGALRFKNFWIYGPTGTGKSRFARGDLPIYDIYSKAVNKWWNGYDGQKRVIIDDWPSLEIGNCLVQHLKVWSDRYPFTAEMKGAHISIAPGDFILIITSNFRIEECFKDPADVFALKRRFTVLEMNDGDEDRYQSIEHQIEVMQEEEARRNRGMPQISRARERELQEENRSYQESQKNQEEEDQDSIVES